MNRYTYRAEYSPEYGEYVGVCLEYPFRYSRAPTAHEAIGGLERMIDEVVADMTAAGARRQNALLLNTDATPASASRRLDRAWVSGFSGTTLTRYGA